MSSIRCFVVAVAVACCSAELTSLDAEVYPRDFKQIPVGTDYGEGKDAEFNKDVEEISRIGYLGDSLGATLKLVTEAKKHPTFTTALIAGDMVILDQIVKQGLIDKIQVVFVDTFHLFPETPLFMKEVEKHYGFKAKWYHAKDTETEAEFKEKFGKDWWSNDIDAYDMKCKVEPLKRSLSENNNDMWINGRRRDMGALRANLPIWEGGKVGPYYCAVYSDSCAYPLFLFVCSLTLSHSGPSKTAGTTSRSTRSLTTPSMTMDTPLLVTRRVPSPLTKRSGSHTVAKGAVVSRTSRTRMVVSRLSAVFIPSSLSAASLPPRASPSPSSNSRDP
jgi:hypothetical protein